MSFGLLRFWARLVVEIVVSNLQVLGAILSPRQNAIQPHFLRVRVRQTSDLGKVILANSITLTPGTVSVALIGDELLVHALTRASGQAVRDGQLDLLVPSDVEEVQP
jgi:multicomponent Na+:H+ antiporter subunit E